MAFFLSLMNDGLDPCAALLAAINLEPAIVAATNAITIPAATASLALAVAPRASSTYRPRRAIICALLVRYAAI